MKNKIKVEAEIMTENNIDLKVYRNIENLQIYVKEQLDHGSRIYEAEKTARILARPGKPGEHIISWSEDADGNPIVEKEMEAAVDPETNIPDWVVTKLDESGCEWIDRNGHKNMWIIKNSVFRKKYEEDPEKPGIYMPVGKKQHFIRLSEAVHVLQWGEEWNVDAGGYINITNGNDLYCISKRDFEDTYRIRG